MNNSWLMRSFLTLLNSFLIIGCLLCGSCSYYVYAPEEGNLLALNEKGDLKTSGSVGAAFAEEGANTSYGFQAGFSPMNNLGIQSSFFHIQNTYNNERLGEVYIASGALGYYHFKSFDSVNESTPEEFSRQGLLFDAYFGYGRGETRNYYFAGGTSTLKFNKTYLQGGLHWQGKVVGVSLVGRLVFLDYDKIILTGNIENPQWSTINRVSKDNPYVFLETSSRFHVGNKTIKFYVSQATLFPQFFDDSDDFLAKSFHMGLLLDVDSVFDKKPSSKKKRSSKK